jgi:RimJ/RimL family protein N-acetyltransferase
VRSVDIVRQYQPRSLLKAPSVNQPDFPGHDLVLETSRTILRPFRERDCEVALPYYADPELRQATDAGVAAVSLDYLRAAGRYMAERGLLFAIELKTDRRVVGEACLEWMNLDRAGVRPGEHVFRVPIAIWDRTLWGRGLGGEVLDRLLALAFGEQRADRVCAMGVGVRNHRSRRLFESRGFHAVREVPEEHAIDLELARDAYEPRVAPSAFRVPPPTPPFGR